MMTKFGFQQRLIDCEGPRRRFRGAFTSFVDDDLLANKAQKVQSHGHGAAVRMRLVSAVIFASSAGSAWS